MGAIHKLLYGWGFTQFGIRLLAELDPGSDEWFEFAERLVNEKNDTESRSLAIDQMKEDGFYPASPEKKRIEAMVLEYIRSGNADERRAALDFFRVNASHFTKDDADVFSTVYAASRSQDKQTASKCEDLMKVWGYDRDAFKSDKDLR